MNQELSTTEAKQPRILHLTLKKGWFDMILSGEKKEEYREIKKHWISILCNSRNLLDGCKEFDVIEFRNGYGGKSPTIIVECDLVDFGYGKLEWGAPKEECFIIQLGKILSTKNILQSI